MGKLGKAQAALLCSSLVAATVCSHAQSPERADLDAALKQTAPALRAQALEHFLRTYASGSELALARRMLLSTYLISFPAETSKIHTIASLQVAAADPGLDRWTEEATLADQLADAEPHGADLQGAALWAEDATRSMTEVAYRQQVSRLQAHARLPSLPPAQLHRQFAHDRARTLAALANVRLRQGRLETLPALLAEAFRLDSQSGELYRLRAELDLAQNRKPQALQGFIKASALGALPTEWQQTALQLEQTLANGSSDTLEQHIDAAYRTLYPQPFQLPRRDLPAGGHPALLELFTGSDCGPCAGPDLALDSLLGTYSRKDLIALEFDEHIPTPDPLATADTVSRAEAYGVASTPLALLDGQPLPILGSARGDVENIVVGLAEQIEDTAALPSGLHLSLAVEVQDASSMHTQVTLALAPVPASAGAKTTGDTSLRTLQRAVVHLALTQDELRYSGKNGIRFHRMVVRAMQGGLAASAFQLGGLTFSFDPTLVEQQNAAYLAAFAQSNDRFGTLDLPVTHFPLDTSHLAVVAWVQDPLTQRVLQSAFAVVPPPQPGSPVLRQPDARLAPGSPVR